MLLIILILAAYWELWHSLVTVCSGISGIFRDIQKYSAMFRDTEGHWSILRHIQALLRHMEPYSDIFGTLSKPCIYKRAIFRIMAHLEPEASLKACQIFKMITHIQSSSIVRAVYSSIFKYMYVYLVTLMHIKPHSQARN